MTKFKKINKYDYGVYKGNKAVATISKEFNPTVWGVDIIDSELPYREFSKLKYAKEFVQSIHTQSG